MDNQISQPRFAIEHAKRVVLSSNFCAENSKADARQESVNRPVSSTGIRHNLKYRLFREILQVQNEELRRNGPGHKINHLALVWTTHHQQAVLCLPAYSNINKTTQKV